MSGPIEQRIEVDVVDMYRNTVKYFDAFSAMDLPVLEDLYAKNIYLRDWEGTYVGATAVLNANKQLFDNVDALVIRPTLMHCDEDALTVIAEIEIMIAGAEQLLVADIIEFNSQGKIRSIRAYKG